MKRIKCFLFLALASLIALPAMAQVNEQAIQDVTSGKLKEAKASWWGFNDQDATTSLQAAINSKVPRLIIDNVGKPWAVLPIKLVSNQEIVFEKGVTVLAKRGAYLGRNDSLFSGSRVENVTLNGPGATIRMWRDDYDAAPYAKAEWRHAVQFFSSNNIKILGLTIAESGGDGIYLGKAQIGITNKDILIKDVTCDKNYRQGISVITAENLTIEDSVFTNTAGTAPMAGIDFEPNHADERLVNCVMRNCVFENNKGGGIFIYVPPLKAASTPLSMRFENCVSRGDSQGFAIITGNSETDAVGGTIDLVNCTFANSTQAGIGINNVPKHGVKLRFENTLIDNAAANAELESPVTIIARADAIADMGGYDFGRMVIKDSKARKPLTFADNSGSVKLGDIKGTFVVEHNNQRTEIVPTDQLLTQWFPSLAFKKLPRLKLTGTTFKPLQAGDAKTFDIRKVRIRGKARFLLYATQGEDVSVKAHFGQVGKYHGVTMPVSIKSPSGQEVAKGTVPFQEATAITFKAPETGLYDVEADANGNYVNFSDNSHRMLLSSESGSIRLFATTGDFFFYVPAGTKEFGVKIYGEGLGEGVKASLHGPDGKLIEEKDDIAAAHQMTIELPQASRGDIYKVELRKAGKLFLEDHFIDLLGVPPLLAPSKEALLVPAE